MSECLDIREDDRAALVFPFTHIGGIGWLMSSLLTGCTLLVTEAFNPTETPAFLSENDVTLPGSGTPFHLAYLAAQRAHGKGSIFPHARSYPGGGAPKPPQLHYDLKREIGGVGIVSGYGLTETPIVAMASSTDPDEKLATTEGPATPGVTLKLVTLDGQVAGPGVEGEIRIKGPQMFRGYLDSSLNDNAFDEEGFFRSEDLGVVDEGGYVTITGRLKDVIIRHGENISAKEVEDLLYQHRKVADVAVIGLPDQKTGERACAVVASKEGEPLSFAEMQDFLKEKGLRVQAIPEQLELVDEVPRNPAGKILKHKLPRRARAVADDHSADYRSADHRSADDHSADYHSVNHHSVNHHSADHHRENLVSPVQSKNITLGQGGSDHDAADAAIAAHIGNRFVGKVAIVTGAGSGIGRATAQRLALEGAQVAALDIVDDNLAETVKLVTAAVAEHGDGAAGNGGRVAAYRCDVTSEESVGGVVAQVVDELGAPSVVCNVAGIGGFFNTVDMPVERWRQIIDVNLTGPFLMCRATLPYLLEHSGSIVNVASNTALMGQAYSAAYCSSKAGVLMLTRALAAEFLGQGVRVNTVAPGGVDTSLIGSFNLPEGADMSVLSRMMSPMGFATPTEIAASIAFLASDESSYTTGAVLSVDGGLTA